MQRATPPTAGSEEKGAKRSWSDSGDGRYTDGSFQGDKATPQGDEAQEGDDGEGGYQGRHRWRRPRLYGFPKGKLLGQTDAYRVPLLRKTMLCFYYHSEGHCRRGWGLHVRPRREGATRRPQPFPLFKVTKRAATQFRGECRNECPNRRECRL